MRPIRIFNFFLVRASKLENVLTELINLRMEVMDSDKELERVNNELAYYMRKYLEAMNELDLLKNTK